MQNYLIFISCVVCPLHGKRATTPKNDISPSDTFAKVGVRANYGSALLRPLSTLLLASKTGSALQAPGAAGTFANTSHGIEKSTNGLGVLGRLNRRHRSRAPPVSLLADGGVMQNGSPVLKPSLASDPVQFDARNVANPVVLPPWITGTDRWQLYYYGNAGSWAQGKTAFLPTGWIGLAESDDGIHWKKVLGGEQYGSILAPTGNPKDWDGIHIGVGDVVRVNEGELHMYYFGAPGEDSPFELAGIRMSIGRACSKDGGRTWQRMGKVFDSSQVEGLFASWPRLMVPKTGENKPWKMTYHAFNGTKWNVFGATSRDKGETWTRDGKILGPGPLGSWDDSGVGTRTVAQMQNGEWVMVYEAVGGGKIGPFPAADLPIIGPFFGPHRLGVARLSESSGASVWEKDRSLTGAPGGPILEPGKKPLDPWTSLVIGTPYLLPMGDGSLRLYFCSRPDLKTGMSIGLLVSETGDLAPSAWRAVSP